MLRPKKSQTTPSIDNTQSFRQTFLSSLSKLSNNATLKTGFEEIRELLIIHMKDNERLMIVLSSLSEIHQQHQKPSTRKEYIKVYGLIAEIYEDKILEIFPKIILSLNKRLKEGDNQLNQTISETMGQLIEHIFKHIDPQEALKPLSAALFLFFENFQHDQKNTQISSAMCISRIIQTSPVNCLEFLMSKILAKIKEAFSSGYCKSQTQLLESVLSLILGVEEKFQEHLDEILPLLLEAMLNTDWNVRKIANDIIYTLCVLLPEAVITHKEEIVKHLNSCRFDKIKHVRDAAAMAINIVKDIKGIEWDDRAEFNNYMPEDDETLNEHADGRGMPLNTSANMKNSFSKENILEKRLGSSKKKTSKKSGILNRPINPEFLKNAVNKNDGIEIKTNHPLLPLSQNSGSKRLPYEKDYEELTLNNFLESKRKNITERVSPPPNRILHVSSDVEYVQKTVKTSPNLNKSPENMRRTELTSKEYGEVMEKMNQIIAQQNMLFEKYNYIENELKNQVKSTTSRIEVLENALSNSLRPVSDVRSPPPYYVNYQVPYPQIPLGSNNLTSLSNLNPVDNALYLNKPTSYVSFGTSKSNSERPFMMNERSMMPNERHERPNERPMFVNERPAFINEKQAFINEKQAFMNDRGFINERPIMMNEKANERPLIMNERPRDNNERLLNNNERPVITNERPGMMNNGPEMMNDRPGMLNDRSGMMNDRSGMMIDRPGLSLETKTNNYEFLSRAKASNLPLANEGTFGNTYKSSDMNFVNNQPMKLENILNNNNYQTFSPSKLVDLGYKEEIKNSENNTLLRTPQKP